MAHNEENKQNSSGEESEEKQSKKTRTTRKEQTPGNESFPIVGIGSSAGGLEALREFFQNAPASDDIAYVVVTHQHPGHESVLADLLSRETDMPVENIREGVKVEPNRTYVLPPGSNVAFKKGKLHFTKKGSTQAGEMPVDVFMRSLAGSLHERAVGIVLSGTGTDGSLGIREIKAMGGLILVQNPETAAYEGMPSSAVDTGIADAVTAPSEMGSVLISYARGPYLRSGKAGTGEKKLLSDNDLSAVLKIVRSKIGHDFSAYKRSTIRRRVERRMSVHGLKNPRDYVKRLHGSRHEAQMLFSELLISVTSFFRDPDAWEALSDKALAEIIQSRPDDHEVRVWVPGCATGEEAYSVAILLSEATRAAGKPLDIRIFATDLDAKAIERARRGLYPENISADISQKRLERYFVKEGNNDYTVRKEIRDMCIFAVQNVLSDPPFMRLDLIVCRNLLIYLDGELQNKLLPTFHYALNPGGYLFLGTSESVGTSDGIFRAVDNRWKIYRRKDVPSRMPIMKGKSLKPIQSAERREDREKTDERYPRKISRVVEQMLIDRYSPVSLIVDSSGVIVYIHGRTGRYLEPEQREPRNNVLEMAREGLRSPLTVAFHDAVGQGEAVRKERVQVKTNDHFTPVDLEISPLQSPETLRGYFLIAFHPSILESPAGPVSEPDKKMSSTGERVQELERELRYTKESNQSTNEELQTANEELQSANEELQSTNEELQSSKEEMESLNEELTTVNNELSSKVESLSRAEDDMRNLLNSTDLAVIFVDDRLQVKRYTEKAKSLVNFRDSDVGRPLGDITARMQYDDLVKDCKEVLDTLVRKEIEVRTDQNHWLLMRVLPYRTSENVIGGVVVTFVDISRLKQAERQAAASEEFFSSIVQTVREPLLVLDSNLRVWSANKAFHRTFDTSEREVNRKLVYELGNGQWNIPALRKLLEEILPSNSQFTDFEVEHDFPHIGRKKFILNAQRLKREEEMEQLILLAMEQVN